MSRQSSSLTDLCKYSGCENEDNAENEEWNYSDIESDEEGESII